MTPPIPKWPIFSPRSLPLPENRNGKRKRIEEKEEVETKTELDSYGTCSICFQGIRDLKPTILVSNGCPSCIDKFLCLSCLISSRLGIHGKDYFILLNIKRTFGTQFMIKLTVDFPTIPTSKCPFCGTENLPPIDSSNSITTLTKEQVKNLKKYLKLTGGGPLHLSCSHNHRTQKQILQCEDNRKIKCQATDCDFRFCYHTLLGNYNYGPPTLKNIQLSTHCTSQKFDCPFQDCKVQDLDVLPLEHHLQRVHKNHITSRKELLITSTYPSKEAEQKEREDDDLFLGGNDDDDHEEEEEGTDFELFCQVCQGLMEDVVHLNGICGTCYLRRVYPLEIVQQYFFLMGSTTHYINRVCRFCRRNHYSTIWYYFKGVEIVSFFCSYSVFYLLEYFLPRTIPPESDYSSISMTIDDIAFLGDLTSRMDINPFGVSRSQPSPPPPPPSSSSSSSSSFFSPPSPPSPPSSDSSYAVSSSSSSESSDS